MTKKGLDKFRFFGEQNELFASAVECKRLIDKLIVFDYLSENVLLKKGLVHQTYIACNTAKVVDVCLGLTKCQF